MRRPEFIKAFSAGLPQTWPLMARAQQSMPVIGWLFGVSADAGKPSLAAFRKALTDAGYVEGPQCSD